MRKTIIQGIGRGCVLGGLLGAARALAQDLPPIFGVNSLANEVATGAGFSTDVRDETFFLNALGSVVFTILSFTGLLFTALILYGGYRWMLARGNESEIDRAKSIIRSAIIGLIVTLSSYSVWLAVAYFI